MKVFDSVSLYAIERKTRNSWNYSICVYKDLFIVLWSVKCHFDNDKKLSDIFFVTESQLDCLESSDSKR